MNRKKLHKKLTVYICIMTTFMAALILYLFTDYKLWVIHNKAMEYIINSVAEAELDCDGDYDKYLSDISEDMDASGEYLFYGDVVYCGYDIEENAYVQYRIARLWDNVSEEARLMHAEINTSIVERKHYAVYEAINRTMSGKNKSTFGLYKTCISINGQFNDSEAYRLVFIMHPIFRLWSENWLFYTVYILCYVALMTAIIVISSKSMSSNRVKTLMSSTLITGFSHELKTPLAVVGALVENWDYIDEADRPEYEGRLAQEIEHMEDLVSELDEASATYVVKVKREVVNLHDLAYEVYNLQKYIIEDRNLNVSIRADEPEKCYVLGDKEFLGIAMGNFLSNAIKHARSEVRIELSAEGKHVRFTIANDGDVIDKKDADRVWELFYNKDEARTDRSSGSGVGLAVTKRILKSARAKYGCEPGDGETIFWFEMRKSVAKEKSDV
ncbi:MAG: HAMP domain-containing histidine kinase [Lachnospiraceae bacterium]|nr:HAMP domain-containing histidine kinase [Lachnospiraceae bacterium]